MIASGAPLVSVICLCYNHEKTISQALESILGQKTDFPFELIVHDDASTDATPQIVRTYAEKYPDIIVPVLQKENQIHTCNIAKEYIAPLLRGRFVAICEGDDYWTDPEKLALQTQYMIAHPELTMSFHAVSQLEPAGKLRPFRPLKREGLVPPGQIIRRGGMFCPSVSLMVRRDIADQWPAYRSMADVYDYPLQALAASAGKVWYFNRDMAVYRYQHANSWTAQHAAVTDTEHLENETAWLTRFDAATAGRFAADIRFHLAHLWFTEYRKSRTPALRSRVQGYAAGLQPKEHLLFCALLAFFGVFGDAAESLYRFVKNLLLK